jgi:hypothetical protein
LNDIILPGAGILFMKVGTHARETLDEIITRKRREIEEAGYTMWGYGGNTCHPSSMVQPFAQEFAARGSTVHLCMEEMESNHFAEPRCAANFSSDNLTWEPVPPEIEVRGSRFALLIENLRTAELELPLEQTRVAVGPSEGRLGSRYVLGRVDKACLRVLDQSERVNEEPAKPRPISLVADLRAPYAVFLKDFRD